jgi:hypothetical protein
VLLSAGLTGSEWVAIPDSCHPADAILRVSVMVDQKHPDILTISVRRRLVPLKHSHRVASSVSAISNSVVYRIYASVASTSSALSAWSPLSRRSDCFARSGFPRRTAFQGDSGAKYATSNNGRGQIHCSMKGRRQPRLPSRLAVPRITPAESRMPIPHDRQTYDVT